MQVSSFPPVKGRQPWCRCRLAHTQARGWQNLHALKWTGSHGELGSRRPDGVMKRTGFDMVVKERDVIKRLL